MPDYDALRAITSQFATHLHLADQAMCDRNEADLQTLTTYPYDPQTREIASSYTQYQQDLTRQIFAEIKTEYLAFLKKNSTNNAFRLTLSHTILNKNIRFYANTPPADLTPGKYALLMRGSGTHDRYLYIADYGGNNMFQVTFAANPAACTWENKINQQEAIPVNFKTYAVLNLTTYVRQFSAIHAHIDPTPILSAIATCQSNPWHDDNPNLGDFTEEELNGLNPSQKKILAAYTSLRTGFQMLMGPPGTGKTTTILKIIHAIHTRLQQPPHKPVILVCGPSNQSVQTIAHQFHRKYPTVPVALYARESKLDSHVRDTLRDILAAQATTFVQQADVLFMTLSNTGGRLARDALENLHVAAVIIDEAGQAAEADILGPLRFHPDKVLLVGDPNQLPPTVKYESAEAMHYDWSMMTRLIQQGHQDHYLLDTQYRMHPEISSFPNQAFYSGRVRDGDNVHDVLDPEASPYEVYDVPDGEESIDVATRSYQNIREAMVALQIVRDALRRGYGMQDIAIITPYQGQATLIRATLTQAGMDVGSMKINTVDSFQGGENLVVIVSMVRANAQARIGFLRRYQRLNVAITRPRHMLRILANGATFNPLHPRNETQSSLMDLLKSFSVIPLPKEEDAYDTFSHMDGTSSYSLSGFRPSLNDYEDYVRDWEDGYYCRDNEGKLITFFNGPQPIERFQRFLARHDQSLPSQLGRLPIFFFPFIPKGTHIVQDILNHVKRWHRLDFSGLPVNTFSALCYYDYYKDTETCEDTGYPFVNDNYDPGGAVGYSDVQERDLETKDLIFENQQFIACDLRGVNFYNSRFINTTFDGCNVQDCQVNLEQMDDTSRASFSAARQEAAQAASRHPGLLPTEQLMLNAIERERYQPFDPRLFVPRQGTGTAAAPADLPTPAQQH